MKEDQRGRGKARLLPQGGPGPTVGDADGLPDDEEP